MSGLASLKKHWYWAGLVVLSALIATAALVAPGKISNYELEREAFTAAQRLRVRMLNEPDTLFYALSSPSFTTQFAEILDKWGYSHRVLRYELYDHAGNLSFASVKAGLTFDPSGDGAPRVLPSAEPTVTLRNRSNAAVSHFAVLAIPAHLSGEADGTLMASWRERRPLLVRPAPAFRL